jgi:hypothetical protein
MPSLTKLLQAVRSSGGLQSDVDAFLAGLARPIAAGKSKEVRATFLRTLLESSDVTSLKGSNGQTVHEAAVRALADLGRDHSREPPSKTRIAQELAGGVLGVVSLGFLLLSLQLFLNHARSNPMMFSGLAQTFGFLALGVGIVTGLIAALLLKG